MKRSLFLSISHTKYRNQRPVAFHPRLARTRIRNTLISTRLRRALPDINFCNWYHYITLFCLIAFALNAAASEKLVISCGAVGVEGEFCRSGVDAWSKKTGNTVEILKAPNDSTERLALYTQLLASKSSDVDVIDVDLVWPGILAPHLEDLQPKFSSVKSNFVSAAWDVNVVDNRLVAVPWFLGAGILYSRIDLLKKHDKSIPKTWAELEKTATEILEAEKTESVNSELVGYVFQGKSYEGLTCNALEWISSFSGGRILDDSGKVTINNPQAQKALGRLASIVKTASPPGVLTYTEEEARGVFQSGKAIFMRNWTYAYKLGESEGSPIRGKFAISTLPAGHQGRSATTLGGWSLGVSKYSTQKKLAKDLVLYLTSEAEQRRRAQDGGLYPSLQTLYKDADLKKADPAFALLAQSLKGAVARPADITGRHYNRMSDAFSDSVHQVLSGSASPKKALSALEKRLKRISRRGSWQ